MKVYISVDMEGIACVTHGDHTKLEGAEYEMARKWMTAEANAAVEGALEAGASQVVVADSHGHMRNILPDELNEKALLVRGSPRPQTMMEGLDASFTAACFVGYHSMAGTPTGILAHTYLGTVYALRLNGTTLGEPGFNAAFAGHYGVPLALACGDDTVDAEVGALMPWTERVVTKWSISPIAATNLTPKASQKAIREATIRALGRVKEMKPLVFKPPLRFEVDLKQPLHTYLAADVPGVERINNGRTLAYTAKDMPEVMRIWRVIINTFLGDFFV